MSQQYSYTLMHCIDYRYMIVKWTLLTYYIWIINKYKKKTHYVNGPVINWDDTSYEKWFHIITSVTKLKIFQESHYKWKQAKIIYVKILPIGRYNPWSLH